VIRCPFYFAEARLSLLSVFSEIPLQNAHVATRRSDLAQVAEARFHEAPRWKCELKSSAETETTLLFVDHHALINHATTGSGRETATFPAGPIRPRSARLARNSANIKHAPIAAKLYTAAPQVP
jgi:hypothetical protein